jgi:hypothetical protein
MDRPGMIGSASETRRVNHLQKPRRDCGMSSEKEPESNERFAAGISVIRPRFN